MEIFVDWETDDLWGSVTEACALWNHDGKVIDLEWDRKESFSEFFCRVLREYSGSTGNMERPMFVFWHHWHVEWLRLECPDATKLIRGNCITFVDIYTFLAGLSKCAKIVDVTSKLLDGKEHVGTARGDATDLMMCYEKLRTLLPIISRLEI